MAHSFIDLEKAVVHVIRLISFLWFWFSSVCPLMEKDKWLMEASWWESHASPPLKFFNDPLKSALEWPCKIFHYPTLPPLDSHWTLRHLFFQSATPRLSCQQASFFQLCPQALLSPGTTLSLPFPPPSLPFSWPTCANPSSLSLNLTS